MAPGPAMSATVGQQAKLPPEMLVILQVVMGGFLGCIYVLLPALFLVFYQRESVRATCWYRNPQTCWTDRCPMPVLALCLIYVMSLLGMPSAAANGCVVPVFGNILTGAAGAAVILLMTLIFACLAWGTYRLQMAAWWGMLLLGIVGILNMLMFSQTGLMEMYEKMQMPAAQLELIRKSGMIEMMSRAMPWLGLASGVVWVSYLWYVRQYFVRARRAEA